MLCGEVAETAFKLFCANWPLAKPVRMLGVTVSGFDYHIEQMSLGGLFSDGEQRKKKERAESAVFEIRKKYGYATLQRGVVLADEKLSGLDLRKENQPRAEKPKTED